MGSLGLLRVVFMKRLAIIMLSGCYSSSASYLLDAAQVANQHIAAAGDRGDAHIECDIVTLNGRPVESTEGFPMAPNLSINSASAQYDLIFVPASEYAEASAFFERLASLKPLYPWLLRQWQGGAIIASLCTGTFVLAQAGLLDGRLATTSWWLEMQFHRHFPAVKLDVTRDFTECERLVCGSTLGVGAQLSLKLIDMLTTPTIAELTTRSMMFDVDTHTETAELSGAFETADALIVGARSWFAKNLERKIRIADVAAGMQVSERTLIRRFKKELGITPHHFLQKMRIELAKRILRDTNLRIAKVAERAGYSDTAFFQSVFRTHVGVSPTVYRKKFAKFRFVRQSIRPAHQPGRHH